MKVIEKIVFEIADTRLELSPLAAGGLMQILARDADQKKRRAWKDEKPRIKK